MHSDKSNGLKKNIWLVAWPAGILIYLTARFIPYSAEFFYARGLYRLYSNVMSFVTGIFPFSIGEIMVILFPVTAAALVVSGLILAIRRRKAVELLYMLRRILIFGGVIFVWYMIGCGTNYYRYEYSAFSGLEVRESDAEELAELCRELAVKASDARERAAKKSVEEGAMSDPDGVYISYMSDRERAKAAKSAMKELGGKIDALAGYYPAPKPVFFSRFMSRLNITGVYFPWTVEANVNVDIPDYSIGVTMCHELSHLRGFMREDEANFIGYLASVGSGNPELEYSGYMLALSYSANRLYAESAELYSGIAKLYSDGMTADLVNDSEYWEPFRNTKIQEVSDRANDAYLKANAQKDGSKSYGRMVDLLLAEMRASKAGEQADR